MMLGNFKDIFRPETKWQDKILSKSCPCAECETYKDYKAVALYGRMGERQYAELPESCTICVKRLMWEHDCMQKLKWYEEHDRRLNFDD